MKTLRDIVSALSAIFASDDKVTSVSLLSGIHASPVDRACVWWAFVLQRNVQCPHGDERARHD